MQDTFDITATSASWLDSRPPTSMTGSQVTLQRGIADQQRVSSPIRLSMEQIRDLHLVSVHPFFMDVRMIHLQQFFDYETVFP